MGVVAHTIPIQVGVGFVPKPVPIQVRPLLGIQREQVIGVGPAVTVVIEVRVVTQPVTIPIRPVARVVREKAGLDQFWALSAWKVISPAYQLWDRIRVCPCSPSNSLTPTQHCPRHTDASVGAMHLEGASKGRMRGQMSFLPSTTAKGIRNPVNPSKIGQLAQPSVSTPSGSDRSCPVKASLFGKLRRALGSRQFSIGVD